MMVGGAWQSVPIYVHAHPFAIIDLRLNCRRIEFRLTTDTLWSVWCHAHRPLVHCTKLSAAQVRSYGEMRTIFLCVDFDAAANCLLQHIFNMCGRCIARTNIVAVYESSRIKKEEEIVFCCGLNVRCDSCTPSLPRWPILRYHHSYVTI